MTGQKAIIPIGQIEQRILIIRGQRVMLDADLAKLKFSPVLPNAFTEHGAIMVASILNTKRAIQVSVFVVRAFVKLREMLSTHKELAHKLAELERKLQNHDESIRSIVVAIRQLMRPPESAPPKRRIGFLVYPVRDHKSCTMFM